MTDQPDTPIPDPTPEPSATAPTGGPPPVAPPVAASPTGPNNGFGTAALVLGIVAVVAALNGWWLGSSRISISGS